MKTTILIIICKLVTFMGHLIGRKASVFPGKLAYDMDSKILSKVKYPELVIGVTGSSGKGSTIELIHHILKDKGYNIAYNKDGSNGVYGITTLILNNIKVFSHKPKKDVFLMEIDERHIKLAFLKPTLTHLVVTNITRDQPARNGAPELIYDAIFNAIDSTTHLIINADDPGLNRIKTTFKGNITTYGLAKTNNSYLKNELNATDYAYCPACKSKLKYYYYHYGHLGSYYCPNHDFERGKVDYEASQINLDKQTMIVENNIVAVNKNILYAAYATLASYALAKTIDIPLKDILYSLNDNKIIPKRGNIYKFNNREINMLESKNENALSYYQSLQYILDQKGTKTIILGFDNVSRRYKFNDLGWLYDVEFEKLNDQNIDSIICIGRFRYDVATRLDYANINHNKIILVDELNSLLEITKLKTKGKIFTMVCFDMTELIKSMLGELK